MLTLGPRRSTKCTLVVKCSSSQRYLRLSESSSSSILTRGAGTQLTHFSPWAGVATAAAVVATALAVVAPAAAVVAPAAAVVAAAAAVVAPAAAVVAPAAAVVSAAAAVVAAAGPVDPRSTEDRPVTSLHFTVVVMSVKEVQAVNLAPLVTKARVALLLRMRNCLLTPVAPFKTNLFPVVQPELLVMSASLGVREEGGGRGRKREEWEEEEEEGGGRSRREEKVGGGNKREKKGGGGRRREEERGVSCWREEEEGRGGRREKEEGRGGKRRQVSLTRCTRSCCL